MEVILAHCMGREDIIDNKNAGFHRHGLTKRKASLREKRGYVELNKMEIYLEI